MQEMIKINFNVKNSYLKLLIAFLLLDFIKCTSFFMAV